MTTFLEAVAGAARTAACGILTANADLEGWWAQNTQLPWGDASANAARQLRNSLCDDPGPVPPNPNTVDGRGQCPDTLYLFDRTYRTFTNGTLTDETRRINDDLPGAIVAATFESGGSAVGIGFNVGVGSEFPTQDQYFYFPNSGQTAEVTINELSPVSGPNICPDQSGPDPVPPYIPQPAPVIIEYTDNSGQTVIEQGDFNLSLPIFLPGSVNIPFSIDLPDFTFTGDLFPDGTIEVTFDIERQPNDTETDQPVPVLPPGQEPEEPELERRIIGVHVFTTLPPNNSVTVIAQDGGPNIFAPRGGSVRFLIFGGDGASWTRDIDIKGDRQYIPCPAQQGAISVTANELPGGTVSLQRVYASVPQYLIPSS